MIYLTTLAEDTQKVLEKVAKEVPTLDKSKLTQAVKRYGNVGTKKLFALLLHRDL